MRAIVLFAGSVLIAGSAFAESAPPIRVSCIGDSITQGVGADPQHSYPSQLQTLLGSGYAVGNFGVGGTTLSKIGSFPYVQQGAWQQARDFKPQVAVIMLGTNDSRPDNVVHADTMKDDLEAMVSALQQVESKPRVMLCLPCFIVDPGAYGIDENRLVAKILPVVQQAAQEMKLTVIDIQAVTKAAAAKDAKLLPDRVHPDGDGYAIIAKAVQAAIVGGDAAK